MLRYSKLNDEQIMKRLMEVAKAENASFTSEGLEAIIFTAQGDMRQVREQCGTSHPSIDGRMSR